MSRSRTSPILACTHCQHSSSRPRSGGQFGIEDEKVPGDGYELQILRHVGISEVDLHELVAGSTLMFCTGGSWEGPKANQGITRKQKKHGLQFLGFGLPIEAHEFLLHPKSRFGRATRAGPSITRRKSASAASTKPSQIELRKYHIDIVDDVPAGCFPFSLSQMPSSCQVDLAVGGLVLFVAEQSLTPSRASTSQLVKLPTVSTVFHPRRSH